jgi:hypothetical protein
VLCAGVIDAEADWRPGASFVFVWGDEDEQQHSATFLAQVDELELCRWSAAIVLDGGPRCTVVIEELVGVQNGETHEWVVSNAGLFKVEDHTTESASLAAACKQTHLDAQNFVFDEHRLEAYRNTHGEDGHCTCAATVLFDGTVKAAHACFTPSGQRDPAGPVKPAVAVGLDDGSVHFFELCVSSDESKPPLTETSRAVEPKATRLCPLCILS